MKFNIRNKLIFFAVMLIFVPLALSTVVIIYQVSSSIESNAKRDVEKDARFAELIYRKRQQYIQEITQQLASVIAAENLIDSIQTPTNASSTNSDSIKTAEQSQIRGHRRVQELVKQYLGRVDFVVITDLSGKVLLRSNGGSLEDETMRDNPLILDTINKLESGQQEMFLESTQASSIQEDLDTLERLGLSKQAKVQSQDKVITNGLVMEGVTPIVVGGSRLGLVLAGFLVNNARSEYSIADEIKRTLYSDLPTEASVSILQQQKVIISSNVPSDKSNSAIGLQIKRDLSLEKPVAGTDVLSSNSYKTAYMPIKSIDNRIIGYVGVGIKESLFNSVINKVLITICGIILLFLLMAISAAVFVSKKLTQPIISLTEAANSISLGELDEVIKIESNDEVGQLAESLERMRISLKQAIERLRKRN